MSADSKFHGWSVGVGVLSKGDKSASVVKLSLHSATENITFSYNADEATLMAEFLLRAAKLAEDQNKAAAEENDNES